VPHVFSLHTYPIKSCAGIAHDRLELDALGPVGDRRCMLVDSNGRFITQRDAPRLALIRVELRENALALHAPGMPSLDVSLANPQERIEVEVWRFRGDAMCVSAQADAWLGEFLATPARLVRVVPDMARLANRDWVAYDAPVAFADGYPILLISVASLDALNARIPGSASLPMTRFRPTLVVTGCDPFAEDNWKTIDVGGTLLDVVKPCDRCAVTTVDPETAERGTEPLKTLAQFRRSPSGVLFGQNCAARAPGALEVGAAVRVLEAGRLAELPEPWRLTPV
jgi:uncharacterized protein YcbX